MSPHKPPALSPPSPSPPLAGTWRSRATAATRWSFPSRAASPSTRSMTRVRARELELRGRCCCSSPAGLLAGEALRARPPCPPPTPTRRTHAAATHASRAPLPPSRQDRLCARHRRAVHQARQRGAPRHRCAGAPGALTGGGFCFALQASALPGLSAASRPTPNLSGRPTLARPAHAGAQAGPQRQPRGPQDAAAGQLGDVGLLLLVRAAAPVALTACIQSGSHT